MIGSMLFDGWADLGRVVALGAAAYTVMVIVLRVSGKRTLAKLNAFDLVVSVALGSVLATMWRSGWYEPKRRSCSTMATSTMWCCQGCG